MGVTEGVCVPCDVLGEQVSHDGAVGASHQHQMISQTSTHEGAEFVLVWFPKEIVEDVISAGGAVRDAVQALGADVWTVLCVCD